MTSTQADPSRSRPADPTAARTAARAALGDSGRPSSSASRRSSPRWRTWRRGLGTAAPTPGVSRRSLPCEPNSASCGAPRARSGRDREIRELKALRRQVAELHRAVAELRRIELAARTPARRRGRRAADSASCRTRCGGRRAASRRGSGTGSSPAARAPQPSPAEGDEDPAPLPARDQAQQPAGDLDRHPVLQPGPLPRADDAAACSTRTTRGSSTSSRTAARPTRPSEVLERYADRLHHHEMRDDDGHAHAINLGFAHASGDVMAFLNSDDLLLPGSLHYVARYFERHPEVDVVYGHRVLVDEDDMEIGRWVLPRTTTRCSPGRTSSPRRRCSGVGGSGSAPAVHGPGVSVRARLGPALRLRDAGARTVRLPRFLGAFRIHEEQKTSAIMATQGQKEAAAPARADPRPRGVAPRGLEACEAVHAPPPCAPEALPGAAAALLSAAAPLGLTSRCRARTRPRSAGPRTAP